MVKYLFTSERWCVKWMTTTALKAKVDKIGQNTKKRTVSVQDQSHKLFIASQS